MIAQWHRNQASSTANERLASLEGRGSCAQEEMTSATLLSSWNVTPVLNVSFNIWCSSDSVTFETTDAATWQTRFVGRRGCCHGDR
jgi:hypothetical protein